MHRTEFAGRAAFKAGFLSIREIARLNWACSLLAFFSLLLVFGWAIGLMMCALLLRFGLGVESLAWASIFALAPVSGIYYPISTLPAWLQTIAWAVPSSHVFEGMRAVLFNQ